MSYKTPSVIFMFFFSFTQLFSQDTFSIVAVDSVTGEVGSAGASCVDLSLFPGYPTDFLGELFPGVGAINTQAAYDATNQANARNRMNLGDTPSQIISWLTANDVSSNPAIRQYGIVRLVSGSPQSATHTGTSCINYKNHITGPGYAIQGNILLGQQVLDSMEARFLAEPGDLACKLMAALQGAKMIGADTRCTPEGTSSLFAFLKVSQPGDTFGNPSFLVSVKTPDNSGIEPIDSLQVLFDSAHSSCASSGIKEENKHIPFEIHPNPASNEIVISIAGYEDKNLHCIVYDLTGKKIMSKNITGKLTLSVQLWEKGIYQVEVSDGKSKTVKKFVKH